MKLFFKKLMIFSIPFVALIGSFIVFDPFRIVYTYKDYYAGNLVDLNRDFVSTQVFINNRNAFHYDSFIFGSSRTVAFRVNTWRNYLGKANPFVFDASGESVFGIYKKIKFIDNSGSEIKNCLIVLCTDTSFSRDADHNGHLFIKHPMIARTSWVKFYVEFIKAYLDPKFIISYYRLLRSQQYLTSMENLINKSNLKIDSETNQIDMSDKENEILSNPNRYYEGRDKLFNRGEGNPKISPRRISKSQLEMLRAIKDIFEKHHTNYRIIISPLYDQIRLDQSDLYELKELFGSENVFDYSGKNPITEFKQNYYEASHYRTAVGDSILHELYYNATH